VVKSGVEEEEEEGAICNRAAATPQQLCSAAFSDSFDCCNETVHNSFFFPLLGTEWLERERTRISYQINNKT
jgi:hypothetical protein